MPVDCDSGSSDPTAIVEAQKDATLTNKQVKDKQVLEDEKQISFDE